MAHFAARLTVLALLLCATPARLAAQETTTASRVGTDFFISSGTDEEARGIFVEGREAYARGEYSEALASFRRAYELSGRPELQFNIGQTADRLRRDREAAAAFETYLAALPQAANRIEVEARLRVLREELAREDALPTPVVVTPDAPIEEQWWFWTLLGVAAVGAGVGIGFAVGSREELAPPAANGDFGEGGVIYALVSF